MLEIRLLGQFALQLNGAVVEIASRPAQALLAYLALNAGKPQRRERLAGLIWFEATEDNARTYLRQALWRVRKAIGDSYLVADRMTILFDSAADYWLDVAVLELEPAEGWTADSLIAAVSVYEGDLLPGFYDDWVMLERERIQAIYTRRMDALLHALIAQSRWEDLLVWGERWIAMGSAPEPAYRALMMAHAALADLTSMSAVYRRCVEALQAELGVEPSEETQTLFQLLSRGEVPDSAADTTVSIPSGSEEHKPLPAFLSEEKPPGPLEQEPFIGREKELSFLGESMQSAWDGRGGIVFITGEAGLGKTTLLREFSIRAQAAHPDLIVASGACPIYTGASAPYVPFREILAMLLGDVEAVWESGTSGREHALRLWRLFPEALAALLQHGPNLIDTVIPGEELRSRATAASVSQDQLNRLDELVDRSAAGGSRLSDQSELFVALTSVLATLAAHRPLLLVLDDLQWADLSSISLLAHLSHSLPNSAVLLVGAYRPEDMDQARGGRTHPLVGVLSELKRRFGEIQIDLSQADPASGRRFVDALLDAEPNHLDERFRQILLRHTGGHPLFTVELLRELREHGALRRDEEGRWVEGPDLSWDLLPLRVEGVIEARIGRLDQELRRWLAVACVEGQTFTAEVIATAEAVDERIVVQRLSSDLDKQHHLIRAEGISRVRSRRLSRYHFLHHLFQRYLYDHMDEVERAYLHERVGEVLEDFYGDQTIAIVGRLARHFTEARIPEKAIDYWLQAGERAVQVAAYQEAIDYLNRGLELLNTVPTTSITLRHELSFRIALGIPYIALKGWAAPEVGETYSRAFELSEEIGDTRHRFLVNWNLWRYHTSQGNLRTAIQLAKQVMAQAEDGKDEIRLLQAHHAFWTNHLYTGDFFIAQHHCEQGTAIYNREHHKEHVFLYGGHDPAVCAHSYLAFTLWYLGYPEQAVTSIHEAVRQANELSHPYTQAYALSFAADIYLFRGEVEAVYKQAGVAIDFATSHEFPSWVSWGMIRRGWALAHQGRIDQGIAFMQQGLEMSESAGEVAFRPYQLALLAGVYGMVGMTKEGMMLLDKALAGINKTGERHYEAEVNRLNGELLLAQGASPVVVEKHFHTAIAIARQQNARSWELRSALSLARLWREQGRKQEAHEALSGVYEWFTEGLDTNDLVEARMVLQELA